MNTRSYMAAAKKALGGCSDYRLAKEIGITRGAVSFLVNGHIVMSVTTAAKLAEILELDPMKVIADAELERGTNDELWKRIAKKVAAVAVVTIGASAGAPSPAEASVQPVAAVHTDRLCIM